MGASHSSGVQLPPLSPAAWIRVAHCMLQLERLHARACEQAAGSSLVRPCEGIYRVPGSHTQTQVGLQYLNIGGDAPPLRINELASAIKLCLRAHAPICGYSTCDALLAGAAVGEAELLAVCAALPLSAQSRLDFIARHVVRLTRSSSLNLMPISNMAKFWGSILSRPSDDAAEDIARELALGHAQFIFATTLLTFYDRTMPPGTECRDELTSDAVLLAPPLFSAHGEVLYAHDGAPRVASVHDAVAAWRASRRPSQEHVWRAVNTAEFTANLERLRSERERSSSSAAAAARGGHTRRPSGASTGSNASGGGGVGGFARSIMRRISVFGGGGDAAGKMPLPPPSPARLERAVTDSGSPMTPTHSSGGGIMTFLTGGGRKKAAAGQQSIAQAAGMGRTASRR